MESSFGVGWRYLPKVSEGAYKDPFREQIRWSVIYFSELAVEKPDDDQT
jgi:hypothetical protein